jgi:hypothetical protein
MWWKYIIKREREREKMSNGKKKFNLRRFFHWKLISNLWEIKHLWQLQKVFFLKKCGNFRRIFFKKIPCSSLHTITSIGHKFILFF